MIEARAVIVNIRVNILVVYFFVDVTTRLQHHQHCLLLNFLLSPK